MSKTAAIIGGGVIGGGWAARFMLNGWDVQVFDPDPQAERKIGEVLADQLPNGERRHADSVDGQEEKARVGIKQLAAIGDEFGQDVARIV